MGITRRLCSSCFCLALCPSCFLFCLSLCLFKPSHKINMTCIRLTGVHILSPWSLKDDAMFGYLHNLKHGVFSDQITRNILNYMSGLDVFSNSTRLRSKHAARFFPFVSAEIFIGELSRPPTANTVMLILSTESN